MSVQVDNRTHDKLEQSVADLNIDSLIRQRCAVNRRQPFYPSPDAWSDQVLYFLMVDRFSDGKESGMFMDDSGSQQTAYLNNDGQAVNAGTTPLFRYPADAYSASRTTWLDAGGTFCGGTLKGLTSKLGYIRRMGATAIWVSPVLKQTDATYDPRSGTLVAANNYHGYATQNFLDVDPRFGTRQDLCDMVNEAHRLGLRVILDIVINHAGDVFQYSYDGHRYPAKDDQNNTLYDPSGQVVMDPRWDGNSYPVAGYRNAFGAAVLPFDTVNQQQYPNAWPNDAIWPVELQPPATFHAKGRISNYDYNPETRDGDFCQDRDIDHGCQIYENGDPNKPLVDQFTPAPSLLALVESFKFWIAFADVDGFRIDTVKHMEQGAVRYFSSAIHEFAQSIGKEYFLLLGEITGERNNAFQIMSVTGLDAALGVQDVDGLMEQLCKGLANPGNRQGDFGYFDLFRNSQQVKQGTHTWFGEHVVTQLDDHDKVGSYREQRRFAADKANSGYDLLIPAVALNLCTLGIPCLYYGTEQGFDGGPMGNEKYTDKFLRECMFGGNFGSLQSTDRHFFWEQHPVYLALQQIAQLRQNHIELRRGRQYLRQISATGAAGSFDYPHLLGGPMRSVVAWSRILADRELLCAINTDPANPTTAWVTLDNLLHDAGDNLSLLYSTGPAAAKQVAVAGVNGKAVPITVPKAGFVVYAAV